MPASTRSVEASCDPEENLATIMTATEFYDEGKTMLMLLGCDLPIAFTSEWYQEAKDLVQDFRPSRSLQRGCWEGPTLPHQL